MTHSRFLCYRLIISESNGTDEECGRGAPLRPTNTSLCMPNYGRIWDLSSQCFTPPPTPSDVNRALKRPIADASLANSFANLTTSITMPSFEGFGAWIHIGNRRMSEYEASVSNEERTTTCYVASETGTVRKHYSSNVLCTNH